MNKSESIKELCIALNKFEAEVNNPKNTESNTFFKSKYAPLDVVINTVKPILVKNGLSFMQNVSGTGESIQVTTLLTHISGEWIESDPLILSNSDNKGVSMAQGAGISITYARRYQLSGMLGISSEDDTDGNNAAQQKPQQPKQEPKQKPQQNELVCESCGAKINERVAKFSQEKYGKKLCMTCQAK